MLSASSFFVSINAEVDVKNGNKTKRRVSDLLKAIKISKESKIFLVIGVPGAGKSVALRKCCIDLLSVSNNNERIPVYINLKEWAPAARWDAHNLPTDQEFAQFVKASVSRRLADPMQGFFDEHFDRMTRIGELFFMFDSFDEMPGILDVDEESMLVREVTNIIVRFLNAQENGRGVIASRYYRRPKLGQEPYIQLDVRPFSESQIAQAIEQSTPNPTHWPGERRLLKRKQYPWHWMNTRTTR